MRSGSSAAGSEPLQAGTQAASCAGSRWGRQARAGWVGLRNQAHQCNQVVCQSQLAGAAVIIRDVAAAASLHGQQHEERGRRRDHLGHGSHSGCRPSHSEGSQRRNLHNNCQVTRCSATHTHLAPLLAVALGQQLVLALERIGDAMERRHDLAMPWGRVI